MTAVTPSKEEHLNSATTGDSAPLPVTIGILALQGAFVEHASIFRRVGAGVRDIRLPQDFEGVDGVVLPGGESTAMALIGERWGVFPRLRQWVSEDRPVWGTCAGLILLSDTALMAKDGGQSLVGGLNVEICRNYFGTQKASFEIPLATAHLQLETGTGKTDPPTDDHSEPYLAVFIRAPAILKAGPGVDVLCKVRARPCSKAVEVMRTQLQGEEDRVPRTGERLGGALASGNEDGPAVKQRNLAPCPSERIPSPNGQTDMENDGNRASEVIVAVRKGNIIATAFHPELSNDWRWHKYFLRLVLQHVCDTEDDGESARAASVGDSAVV